MSQLTKSPLCATASVETCRTALNVERSTSDLEVALRDMGDVVSKLESVLAPLLGPDGDKSMAGPDRARGDSEVAERIMCQVDAAEACAGRIHSLIDRL